MSGARVLWVDGRLVPADQPHLSARDRGFTLGDGLFETMRARGGSIIRIERHLARLRGGAAVLEIPLPLPDDGLREAMAEALAANDLADAAVRLSVSRGVALVRGLLPEPDAEPSLVIDAHPFYGYSAELYERGMRAVMSPIRRDERSPLARVKSLSYLDNVLARRGAALAGADEALLLNTKGALADATGANLFVVLGGALFTPDLASGALPGTVRACVLEQLAPALGIPAAERPIGPEELALADEAFLTSALLGVMPLVEVGGRPIGSGRPGAVAERLGVAIWGA